MTDDGGRNWKEVKSPTEDTLLKVCFHSPSQATAIGLRGAVISTGDGGKTWSVVSLPNHYTWLSGIAFTKDGSGVLVGDGGKVFMTNDNGKSWLLSGAYGRTGQ
jgi:photosystem II stability/assembly factor-like uncharacterized protein